VAPKIDRFSTICKVATSTGALPSFTDGRTPFADLPVRGRGGLSNLAVGGRGGQPEAVMGTESRKQERQNRIAQGAAWAAGIGITLVEMQFGMDYVLTHVAGHVGLLVGWLPMLSTLVHQISR